MLPHRDAALGNIHVPYNWTYADSTAREAATGFTADDVGMLARQLDDNSLWMLIDESPETWLEVGGGGGATPAGAEGDLQFNASGALGASAVGLNWTEGADETDSSLKVQGTIIGYSALIATVVGTHHIQSDGAELNLQLSDGLQINMDAGDDGDVLTSHGAGDPPTWEAPTGGGGSYTDEEARDAVGTILTDTSSIAWVYTDGGPTIAANVLDEYVQDTVADLIVAGTNVTVTYNDSTPSLVIDAAGAQSGKTWQNPPGLMPTDATTQSGITNQQIRCRMIGEAPWAMSNVIIKLYLQTANGSVTWDEVAILKSNGPDGNDMTLLGYLDVSTIFNSTGVKNVTIPVTGVTPGDTLHFAHGCNATTVSRMRVGRSEELGVFYKTLSSTRPSVMGAGSTFSVDTTAAVALWFHYRFS